jgi:hypothetical protein
MCFSSYVVFFILPAWRSFSLLQHSISCNVSRRRAHDWLWKQSVKLTGSESCLEPYRRPTTTRPLDTQKETETSNGSVSHGDGRVAIRAAIHPPVITAQIPVRRRALKPRSGLTQDPCALIRTCDDDNRRTVARNACLFPFLPVTIALLFCLCLFLASTTDHRSTIESLTSSWPRAGKSYHSSYEPVSPKPQHFQSLSD